MIQDKKSLLKTDDSLVIRFGLGVLITVFVIFGGWMAFAPLASSSVGTGKVSAGYDKKSVQHLEGGIVEEILVKNYQNNDFSNIQMFVSHGTVDQVVPYVWANKAPAFLTALKIPHIFKDYPVGHGVHPQNFTDLKNWLEKTKSS